MRGQRALLLLAFLGSLAPAAGAHPLGLPSLLPAPEPTQPAPTAPEDVVASGLGYELRLRCPPIWDPSSPRNVHPNRSPRCPADVVDALDVLSQPVLLVDPADSRYVAFNSLHGGHGVQETPTNWSRNNYVHQTHTTFFSVDGQRTVWNDNPYYSPLDPQEGAGTGETPVRPGVQLTGRQVTGEDNAATVDSEGRVYLASLYAYREEAQQGMFHYALGFWSGQRLTRPVDYNSGNKVWKAPALEKIDTPRMVYVPATDRILVTWRQFNQTAPENATVNLAWTKPGEGATWTFLRHNQRIGPCDGITNPVSYQGIVYIGCFAGHGNTQGSKQAGILQIWTIDTRRDQFTVAFSDEAPLYMTGASHDAVLVDRTGGRLVAVNAGLANDGRPFLKVSYGREGKYWDPADDYSSRLAGVLRPPGITVVDARATAALFHPATGNLHIVYKEHWAYKESPKDAAAAPAYYKGLISIYTAGERGWNALLSLGVDAGRDTDAGKPGACQLFDTQTQGVGKEVFNDLHDSLVLWVGPKRQKEEFVAYGDCGNIRFAQVIEQTNIGFAFPVEPGFPPLATAAPGTNPAQIGAVAGALAGAMVIRMLAFKRKLAVEAPA